MHLSNTAVGSLYAIECHKKEVHLYIPSTTNKQMK